MYFITSIWIVRRLLRKGWVLSFCLQNLFASITFQAFATWRKYVDIQPLLDVTSCHRFNEPLKKALLELEFRALFLPLKVFFNNYLFRYTRKVTLTRVHLSCLLSCFPVTWNQLHSDAFSPPGPEYGTMEAAWKGGMVEAERLSDLHLNVRDRLVNDVISQIKNWQKDTYHKVSTFMLQKCPNKNIRPS